MISVQGVSQGSSVRSALNAGQRRPPFLWLGQLLFTVMHFHILSAGPRGPDHLTSDGTDVFQGMHECVLVAWPGDDNATEKSESRTRSLIQPTMPFAYLPPVVLTISGAPPVKNIKQSCKFSEKYPKEMNRREIIWEYNI